MKPISFCPPDECRKEGVSHSRGLYLNLGLYIVILFNDHVTRYTVTHILRLQAKLPGEN